MTDVGQTAGPVVVIEMPNHYLCAVAALAAGCASVPDAAAVSTEDYWIERTSARAYPDIVGVYRGDSVRGSWELRICNDDSIRVTMRHVDGDGARTLRGAWAVQGGSLGLTFMLFALYSDDGSAIDPPRMLGSYRPPDAIWLSWPGPSWFVDPPGLRWFCKRVPEDNADTGAR